jgi:hypothetical protein
MTQVTDTPVGQWSGTVSYGPKVEAFTVSLDDDGVAVLTTDATSGQGTWSVTGPDTFEFTVKEFLNQGDSGELAERQVTGIDHLIISIAATQSGATFEGTGTADVHGSDGSLIFSIAAQISAQQVPAS